jgi:hypothetical protein
MPTTAPVFDAATLTAAEPMGKRRPLRKPASCQGAAMKRAARDVECAAAQDVVPGIVVRGDLCSLLDLDAFRRADHVGGQVVPGERIELPTNGLQNRCSTAELTRLFYDSGFSGRHLGTRKGSPLIHANCLRSQVGVIFNLAVS